MSKLKFLIKPLLFLFLLFLIIVNLTSLHQHQLLHSFSQGDKYYRTLQKWYFYAQRENWTKAHSLEKKLDYTDIALFKENNQIDFLQKNLEKIKNKENKTADDWIKIAQIYAKIGDKQEALLAIKQAKETDLLRSDIEELYFNLLPFFR
jgi:hypothetical protein